MKLIQRAKSVFTLTNQQEIALRFTTINKHFILRTMSSASLPIFEAQGGPSTFTPR